MNYLYYGDNLDVLRRHIADESVDLVYLDPPFNSNASYNVLFAEKSGKQAAAQIKAFEDTWRWDEGAALAFREVVESGHERVSQAMQAFRTFLGESDMLAYLAMMAPRLVELRRVMKPSASIYLHCDSTASHYLKILMDAVFRPQNFRNEIIWQRTSSHNDSKKWAQVSDTILFYAGPGFTWNPTYLAHDPKYVENFYRFNDDRGRYRLHEIIRTASMGRRPNLAYEYKGYTPEWGWRMIKSKVEALDRENRIAWSSTGRPYLKRYLTEQEGNPISSIITDIPPLSHSAAERLGYPTQKPEALLERIITASSNEGDTVLDPFCGCGTTVAAAQKLNRRWIGIDITHLAIGLIRHRLRDSYGEAVEQTYQVVGEPVSVQDASVLAVSDPYQFQWWALGLVGARPVEGKKGADKGIDGRIYFHEGDGATRQVILSVKAGKLHAPYVRDLRGVVEREKAAIGVLLTLDEPTKAMRTEAASADFYKSSTWGGTYPRLQIMTVGELLDGGRIAMPPIRQTSVTFKRAPKVVLKAAERQLKFGDADE